MAQAAACPFVKNVVIKAVWEVPVLSYLLWKPTGISEYFEKQYYIILFPKGWVLK